jgi:hypothetical protein
MRLASRLHLATTALILVASLARAQVRVPARALCTAGDQRLDAPTSPTCAAYRAILDSARKHKLPTEPLEDKALQGVASESDGQTIVATVLKLYTNLGLAQKSLGVASTDKELKAAAQVLDAGATPHDLAMLRSAPIPRRNLETALTVLEELAVEVPISVAVPDVKYMLDVNRSDADLQKLQLNVQAQIKAGGEPVFVINAAARAFPPIPHK